MFTLKNLVCCLIITPFLSLSSGCASYRLGRLPSPHISDYPDSITQKNVSVAIKAIDPFEATDTFGCEMVPRKINPVFIVIDNKSNDVYAFKKADVDPNYLSAEQVAKGCAGSRMARVQERLLSFGIVEFAIMWIVLVPRAIVDAITCPRRNAQMERAYLRNEIADTAIEPGRSINGVMFLAAISSGGLFSIPLINRETKERLLFQFRITEFGAVNVTSNAGFEEKNKEVKVNKKPKKFWQNNPIIMLTYRGEK